MSNPHTQRPASIPFEHTLFQVKLINLFITWAVSLPNHRVRNESANRTARGAFVWEGSSFPSSSCFGNAFSIEFVEQVKDES